jgi:hypothetical protein
MSRCKGDMLLICTRNPDGSGVFAAMPWVEHHERRLALQDVPWVAMGMRARNTWEEQSSPKALSKQKSSCVDWIGRHAHA